MSKKPGNPEKAKKWKESADLAAKRRSVSIGDSRALFDSLSSILPPQKPKPIGPQSDTDLNDSRLLMLTKWKALSDIDERWLWLDPRNRPEGDLTLKWPWPWNLPTSPLPCELAATTDPSCVLMLADLVDKGVGLGFGWSARNVSLLSVAAKASNNEAVSMLLSKGADPDLAPFNGETPLMLLLSPLRRRVKSFSDTLATLNVLLSSGADTGLKNVNGENVLFYAARAVADDESLVLSLLKAGVPVCANKSGEHPAFVASSLGNYEALVSFCEAGHPPPSTTDAIAVARDRKKKAMELLSPASNAAVASVRFALFDRCISYLEGLAIGAGAECPKKTRQRSRSV